MLEQADILCLIDKQNSNLGDRPHHHIRGVLGGVKRLGNVAGIDDCLIGNREPRLPYSIQVHEQILVGDGEGSGLGELVWTGKLKLRELLPVVVIVQENYRVHLHNHKNNRRRVNEKKNKSESQKPQA